MAWSHRKTAVVAVLVLVLAIYCRVDPFRISPMVDFPGFETYSVDLPAWSAYPTQSDENDLLQRSEVRFQNQVQGPESIAFDPSGRGPYTGVADGRILFWNGSEWSYFAHTSPNRSSQCDPKPSIMSYLKNEHICGRPLGIRFCKKSGELYIADAYFGLLKVGPKGGLAVSLTTEAENVPFSFTNDLDVDEDGRNVYFTDSSSNYQRRNFLQLILTSEPTGRVLRYDTVTKQTDVLVRELQFANGLSLSKDGSFFVFCEGSRGRLRRYWLKGDKAGTTDVFALLPGFPDNLRTNDKGEFWVAIHSRHGRYGHFLGLHPRVRKLLLSLPIPAKYHYIFNIGWFHGIIVKVSVDGEIVQVLEDRKGSVVKLVSEVEEKDGQLWLGSVLMSYIAVYSGK